MQGTVHGKISSNHMDWVKANPKQHTDGPKPIGKKLMAQKQTPRFRRNDIT